MSFKRKDLLGLAGLSPEEIALILEAAEPFKEVSGREIKKVPALRGKTVVNLFFEPSTRTRTSFELAAKRLSADVVNFSPSSSSVVKGETLLDTARNIEFMQADILVLRHSSAGAAEILARNSRLSVINAGDGWHEHPTQALSDLLTIKEKKGQVRDLQVAIVGDLAHSRVARSNIHALTKMGAKVRAVGPPTMIPLYLHRLGVEVYHDFRRSDFRNRRRYHVATPTRTTRPLTLPFHQGIRTVVRPDFGTRATGGQRRARHASRAGQSRR